MSVNYKLIGRRVREVRTDRGLSQGELAALAKTSAQYLSQIENGKKQASLQILVTLAEVLEVTVNDFLSGNQVTNAMEYQGEVGRIFADCSNFEKRVLYEMLVDMKKVLRENEKILEMEILKE